jgi:hypothetical protein
LLKEYDETGDPWRFNVGVDTTFIDSNLTRGKRYWYAVTSFGIPDHCDTTANGRLAVVNESGKSDNRVSVTLPFSPSNRVGDVLVVPNPYRTDRDYTFESGGWEGRSSSWDETKRLIKFIHLPPKCTIRIFTTMGELVSTIYHDNPTVGEEDFHLLSDSNRALASGVYIFTVESDAGKQVGKFALIR